MTDPCIHGFRTEECTSCRTCPHGLVTSRCSRCIRASSTPAGRKALLVDHDEHPSEQRAGFEIVYVPELSGWQVRTADSARSDESYRSLFLARKAADEMASTASANGAEPSA